VNVVVEQHLTSCKCGHTCTDGGVMLPGALRCKSLRRCLSIARFRGMHTLDDSFMHADLTRALGVSRARS